MVTALPAGGHLCDSSGVEAASEPASAGTQRTAGPHMLSTATMTTTLSPAPAAPKPLLNRQEKIPTTAITVHAHRIHTPPARASGQ